MRSILLVAIVGCVAPAASIPDPLHQISDVSAVNACRHLGAHTSRSTFFFDRGRKQIRDALRDEGGKRGATHIRFYGYEQKVEGPAFTQ